MVQVHICTTALRTAVNGNVYTTINEGMLKPDLEGVGLGMGVYGRVAGVLVKTTVALPSVQDFRYMITLRTLCLMQHCVD